jgi:hypothetical protein
MPAKMNATDLHNALGRLPKWAQDHIRLLQQRITEQEQHISQLSTGPEDSDVRIHDYVYPDRLLGRGLPVTFDVGDPYGPDGTLRDRITVEHSRERPGWLDINITSNRAGAHAVHVYPVVSNHIRLGIGPY